MSHFDTSTKPNSFFAFETKSDYDRSSVKIAGQVFNYPTYQIANITQNKSELLTVPVNN